MKAKQFRKEVGREIKRMRKLQKEHWTSGRRYYLKVLTTIYDIFGIDFEKVKIMQSDPKKWEETKLYLQGIVNWCDFLLTIQPNPPKHMKMVKILEDDENATTS